MVHNLQLRFKIRNLSKTITGLGGPTGSIRPATDGPFARPSTSSFPGPPPPYPAAPPASPAPAPAPSPQPAGPAPAPTVAMSSPLLVNLLQNDAPAPQPRPKPQHPAKLDRLEDGQVSNDDDYNFLKLRILLIILKFLVCREMRTVVF